MSATVATVIVPTTRDRGLLLQHSVGSVLRQTVSDVEVIVIGDGVDDDTRRSALELSRADSRVRFLDHPKSGRRGELYRHAALQGARGRIVCYLCDRDLWLPDHLAVMARLLERHDVAASLGMDPGAVDASDGVEFPPRLHAVFDPNNEVDRAALFAHRRGWPLSTVGHTLEFYRTLPFGWRVTPVGIYTDFYMWAQCVGQPRCRATQELRATVLYFKRGHHPGWPAARREPELRRWAADLGNRPLMDAAIVNAATRLLPSAIEQTRMRERLFLIRGSTPREFIRRVVRRLVRLVSGAPAPPSSGR